MGEYESTKALHAVIPNNVPRLIAIGILAKDSTKDSSGYFLLVEFKYMIEDLLLLPELAAVIADLHMNSTSLNGKLSLRVPTSQSL